MKKVDEEEVEKVVDANDSHGTNENGCGDGGNESAGKLDCTAEELAGDDVDGALTDEVRPQKKAKAAVEGNGCSGEEVNGCCLELLFQITAFFGTICISH